MYQQFSFSGITKSSATFTTFSLSLIKRSCFWLMFTVALNSIESLYCLGHDLNISSVSGIVMVLSASSTTKNRMLLMSICFSITAKQSLPGVPTIIPESPSRRSSDPPTSSCTLKPSSSNTSCVWRARTLVGTTINAIGAPGVILSRAVYM